MSYSAEKADQFWSRRVEETDELAAVLYYGMPRAFNEAYSQWELNGLLGETGQLFGLQVMDLACGNGRLTLPLAKAGARVTAVDNAAGMLTECRKRLGTEGVQEAVEHVHSSAADLQFEDNRFDVSYCVGLLEHLPPETRKRVVEQVVRVTRPGGCVFFTGSNPRSILLRNWQQASSARNRQDPKLDGFHIEFVDARWLQDELGSYGSRTEIVSSNAYLAFALHAYRSAGDHRTEVEWNQLFELTGFLDAKVTDKGEVGDLVSELFVLRATLPT